MVKGKIIVFKSKLSLSLKYQINSVFIKIVIILLLSDQETAFSFRETIIIKEGQFIKKESTVFF